MTNPIKAKVERKLWSKVEAGTQEALDSLSLVFNTLFWRHELPLSPAPSSVMDLPMAKACWEADMKEWA